MGWGVLFLQIFRAYGASLPLAHYLPPLQGMDPGLLRSKNVQKAQACGINDVLRDSGTGLVRHSATRAEAAILLCAQGFIC